MALQEANIQVSLFIEPNPIVIDVVAEIGAPIIELHTGHYAELTGELQKNELDRIEVATQHAQQLGLIVNAGHGLHLGNVKQIADINNINELNIGHSLIADALFNGLAQSIENMRAAMQGRTA